MENSFLDLLGSSLIPELRSDVSAGSSCNVHFVLVSIAAVRTFPDQLAGHAPSLTSPVLCTELEDNQKIRLLKDGEIKAGEELFAVDFYE